MKYIRTKDGKIIDLKNWSSVETICVNVETDEAKKDICYQRTWFEQHGDTCEYKTEYISHNNQALKEADTIEELCDLFVDTTGLKGIADGWRFDGYDKNKKALWWISTSETTRYISISEWNDKTAIKGAIWTDKGLIYVAKMNDKGELELL